MALRAASPEPKQQLGDRDRGGQNVPNARGGGELAPKAVPGNLGLLTSQIEDFLQNLCREGSNSGTPENSETFTPPLMFGDLTPPMPVSKQHNNEKQKGKGSSEVDLLPSLPSTFQTTTTTTTKANRKEDGRTRLDDGPTNLPTHSTR